MKLFPKRIDLIVYDFDGVMTDNKVIVNQNGVESVVCSRADGLGVGMIKKMGISQLIITTETNPVVQCRANKLKLQVIDACIDKRSALIQYCTLHAIDLANVIFVGNDVNDLEAMKIVGFSACPSDAHWTILHMADRTLNSAGGMGVVRELADDISEHFIWHENRGE